MGRIFRATSRLAGCVFILVLSAGFSAAQYSPGQGHSIGLVTVRGKLVVLTLDKDALGRAKLFNLDHRTLRFTPGVSGYRVENLPLVWDPEFGSPMGGSQADLKSFSFPFSGKMWTRLSVGVTGSITFGEPARKQKGGSSPAGGITVSRFAELQQAGPALINTVPAISVFFKPRMSGVRYVKEMRDRVVITWSLTEPAGGIQDWTWRPTVNRFQAVLQKDGVIQFSYDKVAARDAIVGIYPLVSESTETPIANLSVGKDPLLPYPAVRGVKLAAVGDLFLKVSFETAGIILPATDPKTAGITYRFCLTSSNLVSAGDCAQSGGHDIAWSIRISHWHGDGNQNGPRYRAFGLGVLPEVTVSGDTISMMGTLPAGTRAKDAEYAYASVDDSYSPGVTKQSLHPAKVRLTELRSPAVDFSSVHKSDGPFRVAYESFHYMKPPRDVDLTCSVIKALGDRFDMLAYYSDFRIDNPEAGTSSNGPLGGGPDGGAVTGIGAPQTKLSDYCSKGRFQWQFIQPVYVGANQMQEYPPQDIVSPDPHDIAFYTRQLTRRTSNGIIPPYDYAMSQIGHEMGHRWSAFVSAKVKGETIQLGPVHWRRGLQARVPFPYQRPTEASAMGGGVWQDNFNGTYTQLDDNYYVPATGYSYLDLYLMGLISPAEVPDFFVLRNLQRVGRDENGHSVFRADRTKVTIKDVIAAEGPRLPDINHSQKMFNTGMVVVVEHGRAPSTELIDRVNGIRERWIDYWSTVTGHRSTMSANP